MKIGKYCQRQYLPIFIGAIFGMLSRRAGLSAIAGLSCFISDDVVMCLITNSFTSTERVNHRNCTDQYRRCKVMGKLVNHTPKFFKYVECGTL